MRRRTPTMMTRNPRTKKMGGPPIRTTSRGRREAAQETTPIATGMMSSTSGSLATPFVNKKMTLFRKMKVERGLPTTSTGARRPTTAPGPAKQAAAERTTPRGDGAGTPSLAERCSAVPEKMEIPTKMMRCGPLLMTTPTGLGVRTLLLMTKV